MAKLFLLLGGNQGNRKQVFAKTLELIASTVGSIVKYSSVYETEPWGFESEDLFWNQAVIVETDLDPQAVLLQTQLIEKKLGRVRHSEQYCSRLIDLDLLFYDDQIIKNDELEIPHPRIAERRFVLQPLVEISPEFIHPTFNKTIAQLLDVCPDRLIVNKLS
ncbi:2-amino-4-hydroxy-6-hydroxymethyldihydropteridine diphosphokinase [Sunxiuqinia indica]|uniref:2-amino-4-hydroxy-6- hydroxymethyldihydropteridine diphosphokinase n=1 Tax=Sunxiuqinia indica TaxID=2692584 RepID=UPI0013577CD4|nr:2-amino-4-hydroxy-6-hydroxymethyldihydropteridine diphosphokinase [Sunxiuqinia indica]